LHLPKSLWAGQDPAVPEAGSPVEWVALTIDCPDEGTQDQLRRFYADALGGEVFNGCVRARGILLIFRPLPDYRPPAWPSAEVPQQVHFEWVVSDVAAAVEQMSRLGARLAEWQIEADPDLRVMLDPAGHPFCLMASHSVGVFGNEAQHQMR
jgi:hypothetical protein